MSYQFDMLNTGMANTDTFGNETITNEVDEAIQQQRLEAQELLPSIKGILATLDAEISAVCDLRAYMKQLGTRPTKAQIEAEYAARELYITMIERLKLNIGNRVADYEATNG